MSATPKNNGSVTAKKKSLKSNIQTTLQKWKVAFKRITEETLSNLEENDIPASDDKKIEALFNNNVKSKKTSNNKTKYQFNKNKQYKNDELQKDNDVGIASPSVSTIPPLPTTTTTMTSAETTSSNIDNNSKTNNNTHSTEGNRTDSNEQTPLTFDNFDVVKECEKLRNQTEGSFFHAEPLWQLRRDLWTRSQPGIETKPNDHNREIFRAIPEQYYYRVYKKLVVDDKPLREPLNLEDAMKVINSGWTETKTWDNAAKGLG